MSGAGPVRRSTRIPKRSVESEKERLRLEFEAMKKARRVATKPQAPHAGEADIDALADAFGAAAIAAPVAAAGQAVPPNQGWGGEEGGRRRRRTRRRKNLRHKTQRNPKRKRA